MRTLVNQKPKRQQRGTYLRQHMALVLSINTTPSFPGPLGAVLLQRWSVRADVRDAGSSRRRWLGARGLTGPIPGRPSRSLGARLSS